MNNGIKALLGAALLSCVMIGCESTQNRDCDGKACGTAQCDPSSCDGSACDKESCPMGAKACADGDKTCEAGCTKPCCAAAEVCSHPNSTFECPNCTDGKYCCAGCAAKDAAACPDCAA